jgi:hypothetical protein
MHKLCIKIIPILLCLIFLCSCDLINSSTKQTSQVSVAFSFNTPTEVVLYKNGSGYTIADKQKIAKIITVLNNWFPTGTPPYQASLMVEDSLINEIKANQTAIELRYGEQTAAESGTFLYANRILIPTTGEYINNVFFGNNETYFDAPGISGSTYKTDTSLSSIVDSLSVE